MKIDITLQPKQKEALRVSLKTPVTFYGGSKGGGKSYLVRAREVYRRLKLPKTRGIIIRKTYPELLTNHIHRFFEEYPMTRGWYNKSEKAIYWPNESITQFSYLQNTDDVYRLRGTEFFDVSVDEATEHEEIVFKILRTSCRTSDASLLKLGSPSMLLTGNPGGIGHGFVKRLFIDKIFTENEDPKDYAFVQAFVQDNPALMKADPNYIKWLSDLPEHLRRAYLSGDWNIHAGMAFSELMRDIHIVKPFELPKGTRFFAGYDHGFNHPFYFVLCAVLPDGDVYVVNRRTGRLKRPDEIAEEIKKICTNYLKLGKIDIYAGEDLWSRQRDGGPTVYEQFYNCGLTLGNGYLLTKANTDRVQGVQQLRKFFAWQNTKSQAPVLRFFENCMDCFEVCTLMQFDVLEPEDVLKMDADDEGRGGDDGYDALRYAIMSRAKPAKQAEEKYSPDSDARMIQDYLAEKERARKMRIFR